MSDVRCLVVKEGGASAQLQVATAEGTRSVMIMDNGVQLKLSYGDKITCTLGAVFMGVIFQKEHNGYQVRLYAVPQHQERKELIITTTLLSELANESLRKNNQKAPPVDTGNMIWGFGGITER